MRPSLDFLRADYCRLYQTMQVAPAWDHEVEATAAAIKHQEPRYREVSQMSKNARSSGIPWQVIGVIHSLECDLNFKLHLHNGDPLGKLTTHEPKGRPAGWLKLRTDQRTWEASALDALAYDNFTLWGDWSLPGSLYMLEGYNGFGYTAHGIHTPYLWSGTQHYSNGKFTSDGIFNPAAHSAQLGAAPLLRALGFC